MPPGTMRTSLPGPYSMKALHVKGTMEKMFVPLAGATTRGKGYRQRMDEI